MSSTSNTIRVARIDVFPIKSLAGVALDEARITEGGILEHDRVWAMVDAEGVLLNGKRTPRVHDLRCHYEPSLTEVTLWEKDDTSRLQFSLEDRAPLERWLSAFFEMPVTLKHDPRSGFPDDPEASGPTVVSDASLREVQSWYSPISLSSIRRRFRSNLELEGDVAFSEDRLFGSPGERKPFQLGEVVLLGHNPCQRCVVPTRDPDTGEVIRGFQKSFAQQRERRLPPWSDARRFNHYYRFAVNTSIPAVEVGKRLRIGDPLIES
jgi:uncharacterized protein YcbX